MKRSTLLWIAALASLAIILLLVFNFWKPGKNLAGGPAKNGHDSDSLKQAVIAPPLVLDTALFNSKMKWITNGDSSGKWPVKAGYPKPGAILPFKRIVAFYGNLYSKNMGILGELPEAQMLEKLQGEVKKWRAADTTMEILPALH